MADVPHILLVDFALSGALFVALWIASIVVKDPSFVDSWWALGVVVLALATFIQLPEHTTHALVLTGAFLMTYETGAELLNFGAFVGFMGVNIAAFLRYWVRSESRGIGNLVPPLLGFAICFYMWACLRTPSQIAGSLWLVIGFAYGAYKTNWFRKNLVKFDVSEE